jgi:hypothetical protein
MKRVARMSDVELVLLIPSVERREIEDDVAGEHAVVRPKRRAGTDVCACVHVDRLTGARMD